VFGEIAGWGAMDSALKRCAAQRRGLRALLRNSSGAAAVMALFAGSAWGAEPLPPPIHDFTTYMPTAKATRIEAAEAPTIDGDLSDPIWQKAEPITEFYQTDPDEGQPATERTDVRFLYDAENLYVYVYSYDTHPERIRGTSKNRDGNFGGDDTIRVYLDPSNTRRNGYQFVLNSLGGRLDQLIQNNTDFVREWNAIWAGSARVVDDGWTAEMAIPFKDLSFDPTKPDWVIEFSREIRHKNERVRWSSISAAVQANRHLALRHADRHHGYQPGGWARHSALWFAALSLRLATTAT